MFGYLTPEKGELKIREFEVYRAHYCGVCFSLRKRCSLASCAALTYDSSFLSVLGGCLNPEAHSTSIEHSHCPFKFRKRIHISKGEWADYAADANTILARKKCEDDKADDHPIRGAFGSMLLGRGYRKSASRLSAVLPKVQAGMDRLAELEREGCDSLDEPALAFADVMEGVFSGIPGAKNAEPLAWMGKNLGRWVYLLDAWDDLEKDEKKGNYNVLIRQFGSAEAAKQQKERMAFNLLHSLKEASAALAFLPESPLFPIVENTLVDGAAKQTRKLLSKYDSAECSNCREHDTIAVTDPVCPRADVQEER